MIRDSGPHDCRATSPGLNSQADGVEKVSGLGYDDGERLLINLLGRVHEEAQHDRVSFLASRCPVSVVS